MLHKNSILLELRNWQFSDGSLFFFDCESSVSPSPVCTWRLYPSTSTVWDVAWQRYSLTKESIPSGCLSLSLSLVCPSVSFFVSFYYKPNVLESIWQEADRGPPPPHIQPRINTPQPAPVSHPPHVLHVNKKSSWPKKNKKTNRKKEVTIQARRILL